MNVDQDLVKKYIKGGARHEAYNEAVNIMDHLGFHIDGFRFLEEDGHKFDPLKHLRLGFTDHFRVNPFFTRLIDFRRPSESVIIQQQRRRIYASITKEPTFKVINSLNKIVRSEDWKTDYSRSKTPNKIPEGEQLEDYMEKNYPTFGSLTNWALLFGIKRILSDPNGFIVVAPLGFKPEDNEHFKPFTFYVPSINMLLYEPNEMAVYRTDKTAEFKNKVGQMVKVPVFRIITRHGIWESHQIDAQENFSLDLMMTFEFTELPVFMNGGVFKTFIDNIPIFDSFISPMLPRLDEAAREYSDLQAEVVQHIHSTFWAFQGQDCKKCKGVGFKVIKDGKQVPCGDCKGRGAMPVSPYKQMILRQEAIDKNPLPVPPAGYISKDTEIVKIQNERIENHIFKALAALNMEFLAQSPLNQSGKAKEVDKEELNNFVFGVAFHLVGMLKKIYRTVIEYRYGSDSLNIPIATRDKMMPMIQVPEHFDLLSENALIEQLSKAMEAKVDPTIINEMQTDLINKKFKDVPDVRDKLKASNDLNPFNTASVQEILDMEMARDITKQDAVIALYADDFVAKAIMENDKFLSLDFNKKLDIIKKMANDKITELNVPATKPAPSPATE